MNKFITVMLFIIAFTINANAQDAKTEAKKTSCCSSEVADKKDSNPKCGNEVAASSTESKTCGMTTSTEAKSAPGQIPASTTAEAAEKKSCKADGSCCGAKGAAPKA